MQDFASFVYEYGSDSTGSKREVTDGVYWPSHLLHKPLFDFGTIISKGETMMVRCGFYLALWARLIEIGIRTTFCALALMCVCFCEEFGEQMEELMENEEATNRECLNEELEDQQMEDEFDRPEEMTESQNELQIWKDYYEYIRCFIENVSSSFGLVLLLLICHDFALAIFKFENILHSPEKVERACAFAHPLIRICILLAVSNQTQQKASDSGAGLLRLSVSLHRKGFRYSHQQNTISLQVSEIPVPTITALKIFELNMKIIFACLDNAIQYGIIIYTAYYANEKVWDANENANFVHPCMSNDFGIHIECINVSIWEVRVAFHKATSGLFVPWTVLLAPLADEGEDPMINIPKDLLGIHGVLIGVDIDCSTYRLVVHPDAFRWSTNSTKGIVIRNCDLSSTDFSFLNSFKELNALQFENCDRFDLVHWTSCAPLTNLSRISITESKNLNNWTKFPHITSRTLKTVILSDNGIDNVAMDRILDWISSFSAHSLGILHISHNNLTRIPQAITSFTSLYMLGMRSQAAPGLGSIPTGALRLSSPLVEQLDLEDCGLTNTEPAAIQGFCLAQFKMENNKISRLEENAFLQILKFQKRTPLCKARRSLRLWITSIDCSKDPCHLAWLIRDNRDLIDHLEYVQCTNGTTIRDLDPMGLTHCPHTTASRI